MQSEASGWQCPGCFRCFSPGVDQCPYCRTAETDSIDLAFVRREVCAECGRARREPPGTGCQAGSHYGASVRMS